MGLLSSLGRLAGRQAPRMEQSTLSAFDMQKRAMAEALAREAPNNPEIAEAVLSAANERELVAIMQHYSRGLGMPYNVFGAARPTGYNGALPGPQSQAIPGDGSMNRLKLY